MFRFYVAPCQIYLMHCFFQLQGYSTSLSEYLIDMDEDEMKACQPTLCMVMLKQSQKIIYLDMQGPLTKIQIEKVAFTHLIFGLAN